jgi:ribose/xylose/arabinose/galactoside ABC-type transport system permease subunit
VCGGKKIGGYFFVLYFLIAIVIGLVLSRARFGTHVYMLGTNARAARFAGLNNASILLRTYMISGLLSSVAGLIMMARANSAKADYGAPYTLQCVLIAVLGGVDPNGGFGKIAGVTMAICSTALSHIGRSAGRSRGRTGQEVLVQPVLDQGVADEPVLEQGIHRIPFFHRSNQL